MRGAQVESGMKANLTNTKVIANLMAFLGLLILQNWKFNKTGASPHGISGVVVLLDQHIAKIVSKIPQTDQAI